MSAAATLPPRLARWLLAQLVVSQDRDAFLSDADEGFAQRVVVRGPHAARRWYWRQTLQSVPPLVRHRAHVRSRPGSLPPSRSPMWQTVWDDIRYFVRTSRRAPLVSVTVVATMVLGIGVTTAVFSVVNGVVLLPLPFAHSDRVDRFTTLRSDGEATPWVPYADLLDYAHEAPGIADVAIFSPQTSTLVHGDFAKVISIATTNAAYPRVFGLRTQLGRFFEVGEFTAGGRHVAIVSDRFWRRELNGDSTVLGKTLSLDDVPTRVVGILAPTEFTYPEDLDVITPLYIGDAPNTGMLGRSCGCIQGAALRKPGVSVDAGRAEVRAIFRRIATEYPAAKGTTRVQLEPLHDALVGPVRPTLMLLSAAVATVLFIACVNVANLLLGQSRRRSRELAVRAALGGRVGRLAQQLLTESMLMAIGGGLIGALLAPKIAHVLVLLYPTPLPRASAIGIDGRVLVVSLLMTLAAGVLAGVPAMRMTATLNLVDDLRAGARGTLTRAQRRFGGLLITAQVALSVAFLFAAGLFTRTLLTMTRIDPGFDRARLLTFHVAAPGGRYHTETQVATLYRDIADAVHTLPGVVDVGYTSQLPFGDGSYIDAFISEDRGDQGADNPHGALAVVSAGFERVMGIPIVRGRGFRTTDDSGAAPVVLINEALAKHAYPDEDPVGRLVTWSGVKHVRIVGVLRDVHLHDLTAEPEPEFYLPDAQVPWSARYMIVKVSGNAGAVATPIQRVLQTIDPTMAMTSIHSMDDRVARSVAPQRFRAALVGVLGALALVLAVLGIYGVVTSSVAGQTREIGIRLALGEDVAHVRWRVVLAALRVTGFGAAIGVAIALAVGRWSAAFLFGVSPYDPALLLAINGAVAAVAVLAAYGPARRASRMDPLTALRMD